MTIKFKISVFMNFSNNRQKINTYIKKFISFKYLLSLKKTNIAKAAEIYWRDVSANLIVSGNDGIKIKES
jgi:hypothetical protein